MEDISLDLLKEEIIKLVKEGKVDNRKLNGTYSSYVAENEGLKTMPSTPITIYGGNPCGKDFLW